MNAVEAFYISENQIVAQVQAQINVYDFLLTVLRGNGLGVIFYWKLIYIRKIEEFRKLGVKIQGHQFGIRACPAGIFRLADILDPLGNVV